MLTSTTNEISGKTISETLGTVKGATVESTHIGRDFGASLKTIVGGEVKAYSEMMDHARAVATERMIADAEKLGADAIVGMRYSSSAVMQNAAEILAYGTAVKLK